MTQSFRTESSRQLLNIGSHTCIPQATRGERERERSANDMTMKGHGHVGTENRSGEGGPRNLSEQKAAGLLSGHPVPSSGKVALGRLENYATIISGDMKREIEMKMAANNTPPHPKHKTKPTRRHREEPIQVHSSRPVLPHLLTTITSSGPHPHPSNTHLFQTICRSVYR